MDGTEVKGRNSQVCIKVNTFRPPVYLSDKGTCALHLRHTGRGKMDSQAGCKNLRHRARPDDCDQLILYILRFHEPML